jgi:AcrR family transcriptional regulator
MTTSTRRWAKTDETQSRILEAATDVFAARGYTAATMADIVHRSGASIGSIYHHFGGKRELFLAIFDGLADEIDRRIAEDTVRVGPRSRHEEFEGNVRSYLKAIWANRRAAMVLSAGDAPVGFDAVRRAGMFRGFGRWMSVLQLDKSPRGQLLSRILIAAMAEASTMVIACDDAAEVEPITDAAIEWIDRLTR